MKRLALRSPSHAHGVLIRQQRHRSRRAERDDGGSGAARAAEDAAHLCPGTGSIAVGATVSTFTVTQCSPDGEPADAAGNKVVFGMRGEGTTKSAIEFTVSVRRIETAGDQQTFSDEVFYQDTAPHLGAARTARAGGPATGRRNRCGCSRASSGSK